MSAQQASQMDGDLIARAGREIWERRIDDRRRRTDGSQVRRRVASSDRLINDPEERPPIGDRPSEPGAYQRLYRLEAEVGLPLPLKALRARPTVRLHAA